MVLSVEDCTIKGRKSNEPFPLETVAKTLLELYKAPSGYTPHYGKVLRRTPGTYRLVWYRGRKIMKLTLELIYHSST